jgi:D-sedoheptulose 7-phosphate isomerase
MLGRGGGVLRELVDMPLVIPTENGAHAQEMHMAISHALCDLIEGELE